MILFPSPVRRAVMHKREGKCGIKEDKSSSSGEIFWRRSQYRERERRRSSIPPLSGLLLEYPVEDRVNVFRIVVVVETLSDLCFAQLASELFVRQQVTKVE